MRDGKVVWVALFCETIPCLENLTKRSLRIVLFERRCGTGRSSIVSRRGRYVNRRLFLSSSLGVENEDPADRGDLASSSSRDDAGRDGTVKYRLPKGTIRQSSVVFVFISRGGERGPGR